MDPAGISQVKLIDATPIGINVRSTAATYANVHDELRKVFAKTADAKNMGYKAGDFSYNTGSFAAPYVTAPARSAWTYSFCPMWTFHARSAEVPDIPKRHLLLNTRIKKGKVFLSRNLWTWTSIQPLKPAMTSNW